MKKVYSNWYKGISRSKYDEDGMYGIVNCDVHSDVGAIKCSYAFTKDSGATVTEQIGAVASDTSNNTYWVSISSGKIWKRTAAGVWSLAHTNTNGSMSGCAYYNGYIYYVSGRYVGRYDLSSTWTDTFADLGISSTRHPMCTQNLKLYIGNGRYVSSIDESDNFTVNALDLPTGHSIRTLDPYEADIVIGTETVSDVIKCGVFRWDTYSDSWTIEDYVDEDGVFVSVRADNYLYYQIGIRGANMYQYDGARLNKMFQLRDGGNTVWGTGAITNGSANYNGVPLMVNDRGVYSINRNDPTLPLAQVIEYVSANGQGTEPRAIVVLGTEILLAYYGGGYGVDVMDLTSRATGVITTPEAFGSFNNVKVKYISLPTGTSIGIETKVDGGSWVSQTVIDDTINKVCYFDGGLGTNSTLMARVTLNPSGASTPVVEEIIFE